MADADGAPAPAVEHGRTAGSDAAMPARPATLGDGVTCLEQVIEAIPIAMVAISPDDIIRTLNGAAERMFGYSRTELTGRPAEDLLPERHRTILSQAHSPTWSELAKRGGELFGLRKDGTEFPIEISLHPIEIGSAPVVLCSILDPSTRRQSEEAARQSEALFAAVFRASPNMISLTTMAEGRYVDVNESFLRIWGRQRSDVIGRTSKEIGFGTTKRYVAGCSKICAETASCAASRRRYGQAAARFGISSIRLM